LTLRLSATGHDRYVQLDFVGMLSDEMTRTRRRRFLRLAWPAPLRVAVSADESGRWGWAEEWTSALDGLEGDLELRFTGREVRRGQ
jgi:hypothetical protein